MPVNSPQACRRKGCLSDDASHLEQQTTGNFLVTPDDSPLVLAVISKTIHGWRVFSNNAARKNSRTYSATPEEAARKYYKKSITFVRLPEAVR
jgi:hypothetical protein